MMSSGDRFEEQPFHGATATLIADEPALGVRKFSQFRELREISCAGVEDTDLKSAGETGHELFSQNRPVLHQPVMEFDDHMAGSQAFDDVVGEEIEFGTLDIDQHGGRSRVPVDGVPQFRRIGGAVNLDPITDAVEFGRMTDTLLTRG